MILPTPSPIHGRLFSQETLRRDWPIVGVLLIGATLFLVGGAHVLWEQLRQISILGLVAVYGLLRVGQLAIWTHGFRPRIRARKSTEAVAGLTARI